MILAAITTCRRNPAMLERAVKSVIAQTYTDWNLVVVDDSPSDYELREDVRKMIEGYSSQDSRIRYVQHEKNCGVSQARNTALAVAVDSTSAEYDYIAYLDDDDEWLPEKLEYQAAKFKECSENTALVYCGYYLMDDINGTSREIRKSFADDNLRDELMRYNVLGSPSFVLARPECLAEYGGFDTELASGIEDWDMWMRVTQKYDAAYVDMPLVNYHLGHTQRGQTQDKAAVDAARVRKSIRETCHILEKNREYFAKYKYAYWIRLSGLAVSYRKNREIGKSFSTFLKAVSLQPLRVLGNLRILSNMLFPSGLIDRWKLRAWLQNLLPERFYWQVSLIYRKLMRRFF